MTQRTRLTIGGRGRGCRRPAAALSALLRLLGALAGAGLVLTFAVAPAVAHDVLVSTSPGDRQEVARTPATVVLTFDLPAVAMGTQLVVTGPAGQVQVGPPRLVDNTVSQDLQGGSPAGAYTVSWRVTSADGHPVSGQFAFTSRAPGTGRPGTATPVPVSAAPASGRTVPAWVWLAAGVAIVGAVMLFSRRGRGSADVRGG